MMLSDDMCCGLYSVWLSTRTVAHVTHEASCLRLNWFIAAAAEHPGGKFSVLGQNETGQHIIV